MLSSGCMFPRSILRIRLVFSFILDASSSIVQLCLSRASFIRVSYPVFNSSFSVSKTSCLVFLVCRVLFVGDIFCGVGVQVFVGFPCCAHLLQTSSVVPSSVTRWERPLISSPQISHCIFISYLSIYFKAVVFLVNYQ